MAYNYNTMYQSLQLALSNANEMNSSQLRDIRPLVIFMNNALIGLGYRKDKDRKAIRLKILSLILQREVNTTYELSTDESYRILGWFTDVDGTPREGAFQFLDDLAKRAKVSNKQSEIQNPFPWIGMD